MAFRLIVLVLVVCSLVSEAKDDGSCIKVTSNVVNPKNHWYTPVVLTGKNTCDKSVDLTGAKLRVESNYGTGKVWGSQEFIPRSEPKYDGSATEWVLTKTSWGARPELQRGATFTIKYGVSLKNKEPVSIKSVKVSSSSEGAPSGSNPSKPSQPTAPAAPAPTQPSQEPAKKPDAGSSNTSSGSNSGNILSIFWCGFTGEFCGQSKDDDIYPRATHVILAFGNTNDADGSIKVDAMPVALIKKWHADGKVVLISVGGEGGHWGPIFAHPDSFVKSIVKIVNDNNLDGVDLDIEGYKTHPAIVSKTIKLLREKIGKKLIVVSPENLTVFPQAGVPIPDAATGSGYYNYFVPILRASMQYIDLIQPQFYNNRYVGAPPGTTQFIVDNFLGWLNKYPGYTIPDFDGVPVSKLVMGLSASPQAANAAYYASGAKVMEAIKMIKDKHGYDVRGVMMWDSMWDKKNNFEIAKASADALGL